MITALKFNLSVPLDHDGKKIRTLHFRALEARDVGLWERMHAVVGEADATMGVLAALCGLPSDVFGRMAIADLQRLIMEYPVLFGERV